MIKILNKTKWALLLSILMMLPNQTFADTTNLYSKDYNQVVNLTTEEINYINSNRDVIHKNLSELGVETEVIDNLIEKVLSGQLLDCHNPDMKVFSKEKKYNGYIINEYPDGSVTAVTDTDPRLRGTTLATKIISKSAYHSTVEQTIRATNGLSTLTYMVTWTDNTGRARSTIDSVTRLGSFLCTWDGYNIKDYGTSYELRVYANTSYGSYSDRSTIGNGALTTYN